MASTPAASASSSPFPISDDSRTAYSNTLTTLIAVGSALFFATYMCAFILTYRYARSNPRGLNKTSGVHLQRYAPAFYVFVVTSSLIEVSLASWLLIQDAYIHNAPNTQTRAAAALLLFCSCWTAFTAGAYSMLFLHPQWAEQPIASIGAQAIWVFFTWLVWIIGAGLLDGALPDLLVRSKCAGLVYCSQIQGLFAIAVLSILTMTAGMCVLTWLVWSSTGNTIRLPQRSGSL